MVWIILSISLKLKVTLSKLQIRQPIAISKIVLIRYSIERGLRFGIASTIHIVLYLTGVTAIWTYCSEVPWVMEWGKHAFVCVSTAVVLFYQLLVTVVHFILSVTIYIYVIRLASCRLSSDYVGCRNWTGNHVVLMGEIRGAPVANSKRICSSILKISLMRWEELRIECCWRLALIFRWIVADAEVTHCISYWF